MELRAGRAHEEQRPADVARGSLEQVEERLLRPVQVLDEDDDRALAGEVAQELDPGLLEPVAGRQRVEIAGDVEPEREPEDLAVAESRALGVRVVALEDAEVLAEDLAERPNR